MGPSPYCGGEFAYTTSSHEHYWGPAGLHFNQLCYQKRCKKKRFPLTFGYNTQPAAQNQLGGTNEDRNNKYGNLGVRKGY